MVNPFVEYRWYSKMRCVLTIDLYLFLYQLKANPPINVLFKYKFLKIEFQESIYPDKTNSEKINEQRYRLLKKHHLWWFLMYLLQHTEVFAECIFLILFLYMSNTLIQNEF